MKSYYILLLVTIFSVSISLAQNVTDTTIILQEVSITAYPSKPLLLHSASSVSIIGQQQISDFTNHSLVPVMNSVAGLRMEERSPGSYRLSIRGSLLRSPFGIRNIKIYLNEFPLTDAGGNTYLNLLDANSISSVQILKGPEGSMFGANTGGVVLIDAGNKTGTPVTELSLGTGSYNLFHEQLNLNRKWKHYSLNIKQAVQFSDGYRENSALQRKYLYSLQNWEYKKGSFKLLILGSRLHYETPGGLTLAQFKEDPKQARPSTATLPGAAEQKAGIYNSTVFTGFSNEINLKRNLKHVVTLFGSYTDFKNPFITNFETKKEQSTGLRTYIEKAGESSHMNWKWDLGIEWQRTKSKISNAENNSGQKGALQSSDDLIAMQNFVFSQFSTLIQNRIQIETAISLNFYRFRYRSIYPVPGISYTSIDLKEQLMPRVGISCRIIHNLVWRASASRGYSPPTLSVLRPSDNNIYEDLQPESGWNYETGFRLKSTDQRWYADLVVFRFDLKNAIVRRTDTLGQEYFINAGSTNQSGLEFELYGEFLKNRDQSFLKRMELRNSLTIYDFTFTNYSDNLNSYSGNKITGVPGIVNVSSLKLLLTNNFELFISHTFTGKIPLNDSNSVYSSSYNLSGTKLKWEITGKKKFVLNLSFGVENIFDAKYSSGNDINAAGNRFYNPAPPRTYFLGIGISL